MHCWIGIGLHVEAETVLHAGVEPFHAGVPHLSGAVGVGIERKLDEGLLSSRLEQSQRARCRVLGEDGKVDVVAPQGRAQGKRGSAVQAITSKRSGRRFQRLARSRRFSWHGLRPTTGQEDG